MCVCCTADRSGLNGALDAGTMDVGTDVGPDAAPDGDDVDECPDDPDKNTPGVCGCGVPDDDADEDGTPDCIDECRTDPAKTEPGECGCGAPDVDDDSDGSFACNDCDDANANAFPGQTETCNTTDDDCDGEIDEEACDPGCSDGTREAFEELDRFPSIAGCAGGWSTPGLRTAATCARASGNSSANPAGTGCSAADLCAAGWHICTLTDVTECENTGGFYAAAVGGTGARDCTPSGTNEIFGCGGVDLGSRAIQANCAPLTEMMPDYFCRRLGWMCTDASNELTTVVADGSTRNAGVLCCLD